MLSIGIGIATSSDGYGRRRDDTVCHSAKIRADSQRTSTAKSVSNCLCNWICSGNICTMIMNICQCVSRFQSATEDLILRAFQTLDSERKGALNVCSQALVNIFPTTYR